VAASSDSSQTLTVVGLFDDEIDAEHALNSLRRAARPSANISVLARDRSAEGESRNHPADVTKAVMDSALSSVSNWLTGLAALMVSDHGTFLAAGPIGVVLAKMKTESKAPSAPDAKEYSDAQIVGNVGLALERFGFNPDEAHYFEQRLNAGSVLIAVTAADKDQVASTLRTFADFSAVFIGQAQTSSEVVADAERWIAHPLGAEAAEVIVADVVVTLRHACSDSRTSPPVSSRCGLPVIDRRGESIGTVDDFLIDSDDDSLVRYLVVGHGGILGLARHRFAVPGELTRFEDDQIRLGVDRNTVHDAPSYDAGLPFSRKDELGVHQHFGTKPYWLEI
jgi:sporulation protein YlmC with PRC-barrel domain